MVRGGLREEAIAFIRLRREEWRVSWKHPSLTRLTFTAGIGAFLVGYFTDALPPYQRVISMACIYDQNSFQSVLHENLVIMAIVGAMIGAAVGAWTSDTLGRKLSIMIADVLIFLNALLLISRHSVVGTVGIGFGVGMASMISPIYVAEASPARIRGSLVSTYGFLIALGQFWCYWRNSSYTQGSRTTWHLMLERVWFPAVLQFLFLLSLPDSPKMNYIKEVKKEVEGSSSIISEIRSAWGTSAVRRGLVYGVGLQVIHQLVGYNAIVYYVPNIYASIDNVQYWISYFSIKRNGRRKQILYSMCGITVCFFGMAAMFAVSSFTSPMVSSFEVFKNTACPIYTAAAPGAEAWTCMTCLQVSSGCGFCAIKGVKTGACLTANLSGELACLDEGGEWFTRVCLIKGCGFLVTITFTSYLMLYASALGTVPWVVNSEVCMLRYRGICAGMAAVANWFSYLIMTVLYLSYLSALGPIYMFLLLGLLSFFSLVFIDLFLPETTGLPLEPYVGGYVRRWLRRLAGFQDPHAN
ncbi:hypothetical protein MKW98_010703 [Papaver atlanticum]|uniref:Major facilitator superfamily (MFS) profile domain-containing protein n=1 Tax=Papaver atlanticum TaxID=357466 RepID=A0AAD4SJ24_9MAGN|nr:hypothetical protein MKW98_010703 [Papaver atlanticum]